MQVSLFASAVRPKIWPKLFKSLEGTSVEYEVVFCGNNDDFYLGGFHGESGPKVDKFGYYEGFNPFFKFIKCKNIKPSQCYEIARRHCTGEVVVWIADDCEFHNDVIGKAYQYWKSKNNEKLILSIQTKETGYQTPDGILFDMNIHRFFGGDSNAPLMAPLGMMSRKFLDELGGIDQRYVSGQYENDIVCRAYQHGATVEIFGGPDCYIDIDHLGKSIEIGESSDQESFLKRPFAQGYEKDRQVLETSWCKPFDQIRFLKLMREGRTIIYQSDVREISNVQLDKFEPYPDNIPLDHSLSNKGIWD